MWNVAVTGTKVRVDWLASTKVQTVAKLGVIDALSALWLPCAVTTAITRATSEFRKLGGAQTRQPNLLRNPKTFSSYLSYISKREILTSLWNLATSCYKQRSHHGEEISYVLDNIVRGVIVGWFKTRNKMQTLYFWSKRFSAMTEEQKS